MRFRAHRYPTRYPATVVAGGVQMDGVITSVSASGACITLRDGIAPHDRLAVGQTIVVNHATCQISATVRWMRDGKTGLTFARPLLPRDLDRLRYGMQSTGLRHAGSSHLTELR